MDISNCTVRGRFISQGKEILTHHFLLCIVHTKELHMLSTSLAADPDCKGDSERMPSEEMGFKRGFFLLNTYHTVNSIHCATDC